VRALSADFGMVLASKNSLDTLNLVSGGYLIALAGSLSYAGMTLDTV